MKNLLNKGLVFAVVGLLSLMMFACSKSDDAGSAISTSTTGTMPASKNMAATDTHESSMKKGEQNDVAMADHDKDDGHHEVHWSYEGDGGPSHWGSLKSDFATCDTGKGQSPIDITAATPRALSKIEVNYQPTPINLVNNGHTIQQNYAPGSSITVDGKKFDLLQFHFHSPSEHTVDGNPADMVAHLVHKAADGQLAVIGVLLKMGDENAVMQSLWQKMPMGSGDKSEDLAMINVAEMLPADLSYYNYAGSLTTPPCSEGVNWMVLVKQGSLSQAQVDKFTSIFPKSVRPTQPMHDRMVNMGG